MIVSAGLSHHPKDFRFKRDDGLPYWTLGLLLEGGVVSHYKGVTVTKYDYDLSLIEPNTPYFNHIADGYDEWKSVWFIFTPRDTWLPLFDYPHQTPGTAHIALAQCRQRQPIRRLLEDAELFMRQRTPLNQLKAMHALESAFLLIHDWQQRQASDSIDHRIMRAAERLCSDFHAPMDVDSLAYHCGLSNSRFAHLFREHMGIAPMSYREERRMEAARALLIANEAKIQDIAEELGYENPFHFSKRFKQHHGMSPKFFRQHMYEDGFLQQWE